MFWGGKLIRVFVTSVGYDKIWEEGIIDLFYFQVFYHGRFGLRFLNLDMGYKLKIGQAVTRFDSEMGRERVDCEKVYLADAPAFGAITDHSNIRLRSYSSWEGFAEEVGLYEFFYDRDQGLLNGSDGVFPLTWAEMA